MTLLRTMPKKFPPITALDWSPLHNLKSLKKKLHASDEKEKEKQLGVTRGKKVCSSLLLRRFSKGEFPFVEDSVDEATSGTHQPLVAKEHFVFTDPEGQLYHFSVEGNAIRDGTKVPAETRLGK